MYPNTAQQMYEQFMEQATARKFTQRETPHGGGDQRRFEREEVERMDRDRLYRGADLSLSVTRQGNRQFDRTAVRTQMKTSYYASRSLGRQKLLERQAAREKSGFYEGRSTVENALYHGRAGRLQRQRDLDSKLVRF